jgi:hypothetical protein
MYTKPRVLVACETSGAVREAFARRGWEAWSVDPLPTTVPGNHFLNTLENLEIEPGEWDLLIAHPPCTYLCSSGLHWNHRRPGRAELTERALAFVRYIMALPVPRYCIENPIGCISTRIRKPDQIIQPHQFGEDASKATCLWLKGLPDLRHTETVEPRWVAGKPRWANQTDSGQNRLSPSADRWSKRSATYPGIAAAMAAQWSV